MLLIRLALLVVFAYNQSLQPSINTGAIIFVSFGILTYFAVTKGMYRDKLPNYLEAFFMCALGLTAAAVQHDQAAKSNQQYVNPLPINISAGLTFTVFVGILIYHTFRQLQRISSFGQLYEGIVDSLSQGLKKSISVVAASRNVELHRVDGNPVGVTTTTVELKEPLIDNYT